MEPTLTAVVCSYWPERADNVIRITEDLLSGSEQPDRILLLDNGGFLNDRAITDERVIVVHPGFNTECRGKFAAALLAPADCYLLHDDDTSVGPETVAHLKRQVQQPLALEDELVTGYWGVLFVNGSFSNGSIVGPPSAGMAPVGVDAFHGRAMFLTHGALANIFVAEAKLRGDDRPTIGDWAYTGDDILAGIANRDYARMLPTPENARFVDLDQNGVAMCNAEGYFEARDEWLTWAAKRLDIEL